MTGRVPVGRLAVAAAIAVGALVLMRGSHAPRFSEIVPGIEFATLRGEPYCQQGPSDIGALRVDPRRARLGVRHFSREPERRPLDVTEWQRRTGAIAVFNAGQYYPDYSYMGLLVSDGETVSRTQHSTYRAALVAEPVDGGPAATVLDLTDHPLDPKHPGWREVAQSFMLFDRRGGVRVRKTAQIAARTAVAQDRDGRLLVFTSEGMYTLSDFAQLLKTAPLHLTHAMSMDGGAEAQLLVRSDAFEYASYSHRGPGGGPGAGDPVALPAVVTVSKR